MQTDMIKKIISTEGLDNSIDSIKVFDEDKHLISEYLRANPKQTIPESKIIDIYYGKQKVAMVEISYNRNGVEELVSKKIKAMLFETFIIIFILSIIIKFVIDNIIAKKTITSYI
jgi:hypothetical protein